MLKVKQQYRISNYSEYDGMGIRAIMRETGHHYKTVKKYVDKEDWNVGYKLRKKRTSKLEPLIPIIDEWLTEDIPIYSDLANHPEYGKLLAVGRQTVLNYVNRKKAELYSKTYQTAMFTRHAMCEAQVDFGDVTIVRRNKSEEVRHILVLGGSPAHIGAAVSVEQCGFCVPVPQ